MKMNALLHAFCKKKLLTINCKINLVLPILSQSSLAPGLWLHKIT